MTGRELQQLVRAAVAAVNAGKPYRVDRGAALRIAGLRGQVHPADVAAHVYPSLRVASAWIAGNGNYGLPALGQVATEMGVVVVFDLRPVLAAAGEEIVSPARTDTYRPCRRLLR